MVASAGDVPRARSLLERMDLTAPDDAREYRLYIALWWEDPATARRVVRVLGQGRVPPLELACYEAYLERLQRATGTKLQGLPAACGQTVPDYRVRMLAREGDIDGAYREVAKPFPPSRRGTIYLFYPEMKAFRRDPRFWPIAKRLGLVEYWQKTNRWPDFCMEPDLPFDCRRAAADEDQAAFGRGRVSIPP
jgi:hypothetical protein